MAEHSLELFARHRAQQTAGNRDQRRIAERAGGKGVGLALVDGHFRHADTGLVGEPLHGGNKPCLALVAGIVDHLRAGRPLGNRLRHQERDDRTGKSHHCRINQQGPEIESVRFECLVEPEDANHDRQNDHHGEVGEHEQDDALHVFLSNARGGRTV